MTDMPTLLTNAGTLAVSVAALAIAAVSLLATRRTTEITTMFDIWLRYERYSEASDRVSTAEQQARFLNLLNYIENICYIFNNRYAGKIVLMNIKTVASDFITLANVRVNLTEVLNAYSTDTETFCEIRRFCEDNKDLLLRKALKVKGSAYTSLTSAQSRASAA